MIEEVECTGLRTFRFEALHIKMNSESENIPSIIFNIDTIYCSAHVAKRSDSVMESLHLNSENVQGSHEVVEIQTG